MHFLERAVRIAGDGAAGPVEVTILSYPDDRGGASPRVSRRALRALERLRTRAANVTPEAVAAPDSEAGWRVDDHRVALPPEAPGDPEEGGPWSIAVEVARGYGFADPSLVRGAWRPDDPVEGRDMLLEGRFLGMRFMLGVRVVVTVDGTRTVDGRPARVWGWSYGTLEGHLEMGRMDYLVVKFPDTGEVQFRIHAVSRVARIPNPVVRLGFRLFGRGLQLRFARTAGRRMEALVAARVHGGHRRPPGEPCESQATPSASPSKPCGSEPTEERSGAETSPQSSSGGAGGTQAPA